MKSSENKYGIKMTKVSGNNAKGNKGPSTARSTISGPSHIPSVSVRGSVVGDVGRSSEEQPQTTTRRKSNRSASGRQSSLFNKRPSNANAKGSDDEEEQGKEQSKQTQTPRKVIKDLWRICCNEVAAERKEVNECLGKLGLPSLNYSKDKSFSLVDYEDIPDLENSRGKDFLDFYVFPVLLPGIQALLTHAKSERVFQARYCSFDALDFVVEFLYNNNPRYPQRDKISLEEIPFVKEWLQKYPRPPVPSWLVMTKDDAARIIQRNVRGFLVRIRPEVAEMREFWKALAKEKTSSKPSAATLLRMRGLRMSAAQAIVIIQSAIRGFLVRMRPAIREFRQRWKEAQLRKQTRHLSAFMGFDPKYYEELADTEEQDNTEAPPEATLAHSDTCVICAKFREFLEKQENELEAIKVENVLEKAAKDLEEEAEEEEEEGEDEMLMSPEEEQIMMETEAEAKKIKEKRKRTRKSTAV